MRQSCPSAHHSRRLLFLPPLHPSTPENVKKPQKCPFGRTAPICVRRLAAFLSTHSHSRLLPQCDQIGQISASKRPMKRQFWRHRGLHCSWSFEIYSEFYAGPSSSFFFLSSFFFSSPFQIRSARTSRITSQQQLTQRRTHIYTVSICLCLE